MFGNENYNFAHKLHKLRCPVGKEVLGERKSHEDKVLFCRDCNFRYHWSPCVDTPVPIPPKTKGGVCGCGRCGR